jgi:hypothetical protein
MSPSVNTKETIEVHPFDLMEEWFINSLEFMENQPKMPGTSFGQKETFNP